MGIARRRNRPAVGSRSRHVRHERQITSFKGEIRGLRVVNKSLIDIEIAGLDKSLPPLQGSVPAPPIKCLFDPNGTIEADITQAGNHVMEMADGRKRQCQVASLPPTTEIGGPWRLQFPAGRGAPPEVTFDKLISWTESPDVGVKYFSGTAVYTKTIKVSSDFLKPGHRCTLDLGKVGVLAEVKLNGKNLGILWKRPFVADVTEALRAGDNLLEIQVTNLWVNRLIGDVSNCLRMRNGKRYRGNHLARR